MKALYFVIKWVDTCIGRVAESTFEIYMMAASEWTVSEKQKAAALSFASDTYPTPVRYQVLLVEDNRADVFLLREAIELAALPVDLHVLPDGERAVHFIDQADRDRSAPCPSLVILDLNLPKKTGSEVLDYLRHSERCGSVRVLIVTSSDSEQDRAGTKRLGADAYFRKPSGYEAYMKVGEVVREMLVGAPGGAPSAR